MVDIGEVIAARSDGVDAVASIRPGQRSGTQWVLVYGDRKVVTLALLVGVFLLLTGLSLVWSVEYRLLIEETTVVQEIFNTLLSGVILLVSIVVTIAAVGISQELTSLADQRKRVDTAIDFRNEVEGATLSDVTPGRPGAFLGQVLNLIQRRAEAVEEVAARLEHDRLCQEVEGLVQNVQENVEELVGSLEQVESGTTDELLVGLHYDCSWQLYQVLRLEAQYGEDLEAEDVDELQGLGQSLQHFITAREYFKSLYYKRELSDLSLVLLTVSLPVIVYVTYVLLALDAGLFPDVTVLGLSPLTVFINASYTVALAPYLVLTAYVLRAATVTKRTPVTGPFVLDEERTVTTEEEGQMALEAEQD